MQLLTASLGKEISSSKRRTESSWRWTIYSFIIGSVGVLVTIVLSLLYRGISVSRQWIRAFENLSDRLSSQISEIRHVMMKSK